jgi:hypothetical protein
MRARSLLVASVVVVPLLAGCGPPFFGHTDLDPAASVKGEVELSVEQPVMAVEFEASFVSLQKEDGILAQLWQVEPPSRDADVAVYESHWEGGQWVDGPDPAIDRLGLNTFRFRWIVELRETSQDATIPIEAYLLPSWPGGSDGPPPDETEFSDAKLEIVSIYPVDTDL